MIKVFRSARCGRAFDGRRCRRQGDRGRGQEARRAKSRSSATARAACCGSSRWSRSRRRTGRVAYGPVTPADVAEPVRRRSSSTAATHKLSHGLTDEIPYFKNQERLTFARCGITDPLSIDGLPRARRLRGPHQRARPWRRSTSSRRSRPPACAAAAAPASRPASSGRPCTTPRPTRNTSAATPTRATAAPSPTAC